jgi:hypothetical protein
MTEPKQLGRIDMDSVREVLEVYAESMGGQYDLDAAMSEIVSGINEAISPAQMSDDGIIIGPVTMPPLSDEVHRFITKVELDVLLEKHEKPHA